MSCNLRFLRPSWSALAIMVVVALAMFRPGDAPFINDEPMLLRSAYFYNHEAVRAFGITLPFSLAPRGLAGTHCVFYGPAPTWLYQILLLITRNPIGLVLIHAALFTGLSAIALWWLTRTMKMSPWFAVITLLSPWCWYYARVLWDNSLCMPIGALALAGYADFAVSHRGGSLCFTVACLAILPLVHFMALPLVGAIALSLVLFHRTELIRFGRSVVIILLIAGSLSAGYWGHITAEKVPGDSTSLGWLFPFLGAHHWTASIEALAGADWLDHTPLPTLLHITTTSLLLMYPLAWFGITLAAENAWRVFSRNESPAVVAQVSTLAIIALLLEIVVDGTQHVWGYAHYHNGNWIVNVVFVWLAVDWLSRRMTSGFVNRIAIPAYALANLIVIFCFMAQIAHNGGVRNRTWGTAISDQLAAINLIQQYDPASAITMNYSQWREFPHAPETLELLHPAPTKPRPIAFLTVSDRSAYAGDAHIAVSASSPP